jgi:hypothetical protein
VTCSPCRSVTLVASKTTGAAVNAGRLGYRHRGELVSDSDDGLVVAARLTISPSATYARVEVTDAAGRSAWAGPFRT